jgi:hypothetical protein
MALAVAGATQLALEAIGVLRDFAMITMLDHAPDSLRRQVLSGEYDGEALEERLKMSIAGGWPMLKALWHFSRVQNHSAIHVGDEIPVGKLALVPVTPTSERTNADLDRRVDLSSLCSSNEERPLVINFGSCS